MSITKLPVLILCISLIAIGYRPCRAQQSVPDTVDKDYSAELPRLPPKSVAEALEAFEVLPGFQVELVAAEPLVFDPVAFAFDAAGRLFVVEMRDYSEQETERLGRLALLKDVDGDGRMDRRTTFAENLSWPTAVWPWRDGALVAEPPRLTWYRDLDGDGVADESEDWFVGFGRGNVQGLVNSLRWGVDGLIHGATSSSGAELEAKQTAGGDRLALRRRDFAIDPLSKTIRPAAGGGQHGLSFNRWGDKFVTSNSDHLQQVIDLDAWLATHRSSVGVPSLRRSIAEDGPQAEVFRASPVEPWRIVRTRLRVSGVAPGIVEGGGRAAGYFTGATGTWIMDRDAGFSDLGTDVALVCDVGSNLVHRKSMHDHGLLWSGRRIDEGTELLRSKDTWFRPVQLGDGPDGSLYIADMYREVIEHPKSLPPMIKKHLDLTSGRDRGRIWRLKPTTTPQTPRNVFAGIASMSTAQLIEELASEIAWRRRTASQLLVERGEELDLRPLKNVAIGGLTPEARILAMHVISRLGKFDEQMSGQLIQEQHSRVLVHVIRLIRQHELGTQLANQLMDLEIGNARVQLELAQLAADLPSDVKEGLLAKLVSEATEPTVMAIVAVAAGEDAWQLFGENNIPRTSLRGWLDLLLPTWAKQMGSDKQLQSWMTMQMIEGDAGRRTEWLLATSRLRNQGDVARILKSVSAAGVDELEEFIQDQLSDDAGRASTVDLLRLLPADDQEAWARRLLEPTQAVEVQQAVIRNLQLANHPSLAKLILPTFRSMTPTLQSQALRALSSRPESAIELIDAIDSQAIKRALIPVDIRQTLIKSKHVELAKRASEVFGKVSEDRRAVIEEYSKSLETALSQEHLGQGKAHFQRVCAQCHRIGGVGNDVGAPLKQLGDKSAQQLLEAILDPNQEVDPRYTSYSILLADDRVLSGIIRGESANQIDLVEAGGQQHRIARSEIVQIKNNAVSLMPIGIEEQLTPVQLAELIAFLQSIE